MANVVQQTLADETVIAEAHDETKLLVFEDLYEGAEYPDDYDENDKLIVSWSEIDHKPGGVRFVTDDPHEGRLTNDMEFEKTRNARLAFGLWLRCGPFNQPEGKAVPREIATDGQDAITAYIYLNNGRPMTRAGAAEICGVTKQTVSDRLSRVRWKPPEGSAE